MPVKSLQIFLSKLIDYAGLFPPASLDLKPAIYNYLDYISSSPYSWMLAKFICPAGMLAEMDELIKSDKIEFTNQISLSVLGSSSVHSSEFIDSIGHDVSLISDFNSKYSRRISIDAFEVRLPNDIFSISGDNVLYELINLTSEKIEKINGKPVPIFFEAAPNENLLVLAEALFKFNRAGGKAGYKLRTGGIEASAFPASKKIAYAIKECRDFEIPMKCTAGLHHPIRHYNDGVKTKMHGFINVFGAGILNTCLSLSEDVMIEILEDENAGNFHFSDSSFGWKEYHILTSLIQEVRERFLISCGSCSFDEPVDDLKGLKLL